MVEISIRQFWKFVFNSKIEQNSIILQHTSDVISFQYCLMQDFKISLSSNWRVFLYTLFDNSFLSGLNLET